MANSGRMKYRKKPVVVEAEQFDPERPVEEWPAGVELAPWAVLYKHRPAVLKGRLRTLEGYVDLRPGDWIVTGVKGEKYPVRDDIFRMTYEPVAAEAEKKWIETVALPLDLQFKVTSCPFCRRILSMSDSLVCAHYRGRVNIENRRESFVAFKGTPSGNTHLWMVDDREGGPVRIVAGGPEWFEVRTAGDVARVAHRRDLVRIPYVNGIILSSKNDPLGADKAGGPFTHIVEEARQVREAGELERIQTGDDMAKLTPEREAEICEKYGIKMETVTADSVRRGLEDAFAGQVRPVDELWEGIGDGIDDDVEAIPEVMIIIDRREDDKLHRTVLTGGIRDILPMSLTTTDNDLVVGSMGPDKTRKLLKWLRKKGLV